MNKLIKGLLFTVAFVATAGMGSQIAHAQTLKLDEKNFPDKNMRKSIEASLDDNDKSAYKYDKKTDTYTIYTEKFTELSLDKVSNYTNLEKFTNLEKLSLYNNKATELDINFAKKLTGLWVQVNSGKSKPVKLGFDQCSHLETLYVQKGLSNESIDLSKMSKLYQITISQDNLKKLTLPKDSIEEIDICSDELEAIDGTEFANVTELLIEAPKLKGIDFTKMTKLEELDYCCGDESIDLSHCQALESLYIGCFYYDHEKIELPINSLDISNCKKLRELHVIDCPNLKTMNISSTVVRELAIKNVGLEAIDISKCKKLGEVLINGTKLSTLKLGEAKSLWFLDLNDNKSLKSIDIAKCPKIEYLFLENTGLTKLDVKKVTSLGYLFVDGSKIQTLDLTKNNLTVLSYYGSSVKKIKFNKKDKHVTIAVFCKDTKKKIDLSASVGKNGKVTSVKGFSYNKKTGKVTQKKKGDIYFTIKNNGRRYDVEITREKSQYPGEEID